MHVRVGMCVSSHQYLGEGEDDQIPELAWDTGIFEEKQRFKLPYFLKKRDLKT